MNAQAITIISGVVFLAVFALVGLLIQWKRKRRP